MTLKHRVGLLLWKLAWKLLPAPVVPESPTRNDDGDLIFSLSHGNETAEYVPLARLNARADAMAAVTTKEERSASILWLDHRR